MKCRLIVGFLTEMLLNQDRNALIELVIHGFVYGCMFSCINSVNNKVQLTVFAHAHYLLNILCFFLLAGISLLIVLANAAQQLSYALFVLTISLMFVFPYMRMQRINELMGIAQVLVLSVMRSNYLFIAHVIYIISLVHWSNHTEMLKLTLLLTCSYLLQLHRFYGCCASRF